MMSLFSKSMMVLTIALGLAAGPALAQGIPDPGNSTVPDLLLTCPAGDIAFEVIVLDGTGAPCVNALVTLDFCNCPEAQLCLYAGGEACTNGKNDRLVVTTDADGRAQSKI